MFRYNCNRYDEREAKSARDAQEKSRAALQRYLFYCNRYLNHMQSLKFEHKVAFPFYLFSLMFVVFKLHCYLSYQGALSPVTINSGCTA